MKKVIFNFLYNKGRYFTLPERHFCFISTFTLSERHFCSVRHCVAIKQVSGAVSVLCDEVPFSLKGTAVVVSSSWATNERVPSPLTSRLSGRVFLKHQN